MTFTAALAGRPPPSAYFPGVVTLGIQAAQDTKTTAGLSGALSNGQVSSGNKPAGTTFGTSPATSQPALLVSSSVSFANYDFTGVELYITGSSTVVSATNCNFKTQAGQFAEVILGADSSAPVFNATNCVLDNAAGTHTQAAVYEAGCRLLGGSATFTQCFFNSPPQDHITFAGVMTALTLDHCYFNAPGRSPAQTALGDGFNGHVEAVHNFVAAGGAVVTITFCWFDITGGNNWPGGAVPGWTAIVFAENGNGLNVSNSIISAGVPGGGTGLSTFSVNDPFSLGSGTNTLAATNNLIQIGASAYLSGTGSGSRTGNRDFDANTSISF